MQNERFDLAITEKDVQKLIELQTVQYEDEETGIRIANLTMSLLTSQKPFYSDIFKTKNDIIKFMLVSKEDGIEIPNEDVYYDKKFEIASLFCATSSEVATIVLDDQSYLDDLLKSLIDEK